MHRFAILLLVVLVPAGVLAQEKTVPTPPEFNTAEYRFQTQSGWVYSEHSFDKTRVTYMGSPLVTDYMIVLTDKREKEDNCTVLTAKLDVKKIMYWDDLTRWTVEFPCPDLTGRLGEIARTMKETYGGESFGFRLALREQNIGLALLVLNGAEFRIAVADDGSGAKLLDFDGDFGRALRKSFSFASRSIFEAYMDHVISMIFPGMRTEPRGEVCTKWKQGKVQYSARPGNASSILPDENLVLASAVYDGKLPVRFSLGDTFFNPVDKATRDRVRGFLGSSITDDLCYDTGLGMLMRVDKTGFNDCYEIEMSTGLVESRIVTCQTEYDGYLPLSNGNGALTATYDPDKPFGQRTTVSESQGTLSVCRLRALCTWRVDLLKYGKAQEVSDPNAGK